MKKSREAQAQQQARAQADAQRQQQAQQQRQQPPAPPVVQHLNCGLMAKLTGLTRGISCAINPYGLENGRTGSASIDFPVYQDAKGRAAVSPLFDYEIAAWENSGADLMFHNWSQK